MCVEEQEEEQEEEELQRQEKKDQEQEDEQEEQLQVEELQEDEQEEHKDEQEDEQEEEQEEQREEEEEQREEEEVQEQKEEEQEEEQGEEQEEEQEEQGEQEEVQEQKEEEQEDEQGEEQGVPAEEQHEEQEQQEEQEQEQQEEQGQEQEKKEKDAPLVDLTSGRFKEIARQEIKRVTERFVDCQSVVLQLDEWDDAWAEAQEDLKEASNDLLDHVVTDKEVELCKSFLPEDGTGMKNFVLAVLRATPAQIFEAGAEMDKVCEELKVKEEAERKRRVETNAGKGEAKDEKVYVCFCVFFHVYNIHL